MKRLIITGLLAFLISTTFLSDNPTGWFQQELPVNDVTRDISFTDSLNGWIITEGSFNNNDTGYIMRTTNGGANWSIQFDSTLTLNVIQFVDNDYGYAGGGFGRASFLKTTNGGINWQYSIASGVGAYNILDLKFVNKDTGWICSDDEFDGGVFKTTNGGSSWQRQTTPAQLRPIKLFFLNNDTGWALSVGKISKTINGGITWSFLNGVSGIERDLFFLNNDTGWVICGGSGQNGITKTTNGGANWFVQPDPRPTGSGLNDIYILNNSKGWIAADVNRMLSLYNDSVWGNQNMPSGNNSYFSVFMVDTNTGYTGGRIFAKTNDGGGVITGLENNSESISESFMLYQNYPNPFNPKTIINYELRITSYVKLGIYDIQGKELTLIVNQRQNTGNYRVEFDGSELSSGVYFYRIEGIEDKSGGSFSETKKMMLIR